MNPDTSTADFGRETPELTTTFGTSQNTPFPVATMRRYKSVARHRSGFRDAGRHRNDSLFTFEQVIASAKGEIAHLTWLLRELRCCAQLRRADGIVLPLNVGRADRWTQADAADFDSQTPGSHIEQRNCNSIYDPQGQLFATLQLRASEMDRSASLDRLLGALIESLAGAITERWFRLHHRRHWIVAAQRQDRTEKPIALAVDCRQRLLGADHAARQLLGLERWNVEPHLPLSTILLDWRRRYQ